MSANKLIVFIYKNFLAVIIVICTLNSCTTVSKTYNPNKKFTQKELQQDYSLLREILEKKHPSLYWYTSQDSMNYYFDSLYKSIPDSMTELQFGWKVLAPLTQKIHCGHTSFGMSKQWGKFIRNKRIPSFPLHMKIWRDTMIVTGNLNRSDSLITKGAQITSINGMPSALVIQRMFQYLPQDGYAANVNYVRISSNFPYYHRNVFGLNKNYRVDYIDTVGTSHTALLPLFAPPQDTGNKKTIEKRERVSRRQLRRELRQDARSLEIDSTGNTATMSLNTFSKGDGRRLRSFINSSFKKLRKQKVSNLVLDLRSNGGGDIGMYVLLTRYIRNSEFKVADSAYAVTKFLNPYSGNIRQSFVYNFGMFFLSKKRKDGLYHFNYWERHFFKPKRKNHFNGNVYVLTNGPTFSASTLFCNAVKGQNNVKLVGEETGGGWYGNSGIMIPDIVLPNTKLRVRLPLFKIVQYNHVAEKGTGIKPDIFVPPTAVGVRQGIDRKMELIKALIKASGNQAKK